MLSRRGLLQYAGSAVVLGLVRTERAWGQKGGPPSITVYKNPT
jgi:hypothetical protein